MAAFISNLESFRNTMKYVNARAKGQVTQSYKKLVTTVLADLAAHTPQYSGTLAASWQVVVGKGASPIPFHEVPMTGIPWRKIEDPAWIGDPAAVLVAVRENVDAISRIRWNSHVSITNTHPGLSDADGSGEIKGENLREGNYVAREDFMAVVYVTEKYSHKNGRGLQLNLKME